MLKYFRRLSKATKINHTKNFQLLIITTTKFYNVKKNSLGHMYLRTCQPNAGVNCIAVVGNQMLDVDSKVFRAEERITRP